MTHSLTQESGNAKQTKMNKRYLEGVRAGEAQGDEGWRKPAVEEEIAPTGVAAAGTVPSPAAAIVAAAAASRIRP